ncbi:flavoprotein [Streptomyces sp. ISL-43]|uniref:flavoprotein n=1 Tax=Streptomyces sp. ISL-43 TaxID=2819183 RepID=UPI001BE6479C|nr:flavoprotein [Streptomyces sp. ISL-43]MBT2446348.1 flavoprotein [Streptomyces sp. ISL-43]
MNQSPMTLPEFSPKRLLLVGTGALGVSSLPGWLGWLREGYPDVETRVVLTRQATSFVTPAALTAIGGRAVLLDAWPTEPQVAAPHVELGQWAEAVAVYPATFHFTSRLALGLADTPVMLALQCTSAPIGLAPALPPGGLHSHAFQSHLAALHERSNVVVAEPEAGLSTTTGRLDASTAAPLPTLLQLIQKRWSEGGGGSTR